MPPSPEPSSTAKPRRRLVWLLAILLVVVVGGLLLLWLFIGNGASNPKPEPAASPVPSPTRLLPDDPRQAAIPDSQVRYDLPAQLGRQEESAIRVIFAVDGSRADQLVLEISNPLLGNISATPSLQAQRQVVTYSLPLAPEVGVRLRLGNGLVSSGGMAIDQVVWQSLVTDAQPGPDGSLVVVWNDHPAVWEWFVRAGEEQATDATINLSIWQRMDDSRTPTSYISARDFRVALVGAKGVGGWLQSNWPLLVLGLFLLMGALVILDRAREVGLARRRRLGIGSSPGLQPAPPRLAPTGSPIQGYTYVNLILSATPEGGYRALAESDLTNREASHTFAFAPSTLELERLRNAIQIAGLRSQEPSRRLGSPEELTIRQFGSDLFEAAIGDQVRDLYMETVHQARSQNQGVGLRMNLEAAPELAVLPWEYLFDTAQQSFLALDSSRPLVRYQRCAAAIPQAVLTVHPPLRILVVESRPGGVPELDTAGERKSILTALQSEERFANRVELDFLQDASLPALQNRLRESSYHVFHFIGHGTYDREQDVGYLLFEGERGKPQFVPGSVLATLLGDHFSMRLVFLNACEGATVSTADPDPFRGVATSLVQRSIPAVIAMQAEITDRGAVVLASEFYAALADQYPVDAALTEARKALDYRFPAAMEWGKPVLYRCQQGGRLFDLRS